MAKAFIIFCNDRNTLTRIQIRSTFSINSSLCLFIFSAFICHLSLAFAWNPKPQGKLEFLDFPPITEINGVNFSSHSLALEGGEYGLL